MFVWCECCVLSGRGLCDELITRPEQSYRLWCVVVCDLETSWIMRPWPALGRRATAKKKILVSSTEKHRECCQKAEVFCSTAVPSSICLSSSTKFSNSAYVTVVLKVPNTISYNVSVVTVLS
jgi:hypothetical protein